MKLLILDALTQTVDISKPFSSGVIRAALNDAYGMSHYCDVTYAFYGVNYTKQLPFKTFILGDKGAKDDLTDMKYSGMVLNKRKESILLKLLNLDFDRMIIHLHSYSSYIEDICKYFKNIPKLFVVHDFIMDKYTASNMMKCMQTIKKYPNTLVVSNSKFTQFLGNYIYNKRYNEIINVCNKLKDLSFNDDSKFVDTSFKYFVYTTQKEPVAYENNNFSINIGRFDLDKGVQRLFNNHKYNGNLIKLFGSYDPYHDPDKKFYNKILSLQNNYPNYYEINEAFSDSELKECSKNANNLIISCDHEGFGYTAYEMGLLGIPSIIITSKKSLYRHATVDYIKDIDLPYREIKTGENDLLYDTIKNFKLSLNEKKDYSAKLINYFTLENFINDRIKCFDDASKRIPLKLNVPLF